MASELTPNVSLREAAFLQPPNLATFILGQVMVAARHRRISFYKILAIAWPARKEERSSRCRFRWCTSEWHGGPFIGLKHDSFGQTTLRIGTTLACWVGLGGLAPTGSRRGNLEFAHNVLTSDQTRFRRNLAIYDACPDFILGGPTFRWLSESLKTIAKVQQSSHLASIRIPTLLLGAGSDDIVPHNLLEDMASRFRASELITIDRARHELFQEADLYRNQVMAAIKAFIPGGE